MTKLTSIQKKELDLLKKGGGYCYVFNDNLMRTFQALEKKGLVKIQGYSVYIEED